jgi:alkylation response protein AidB-like acyl-CoA dehydrogenase
MKVAFGAEQEEARVTYRAFVEREIIPRADAIDRDESVPADLIASLAGRGYLGAMLPREFGGTRIDLITAGLLHEEIGRGSASVHGVLNVHNMAAQAVLRWGSRTLREAWIPRFARGERLAAFAITEPNAGSDAASVETEARRAGDAFVLDGEKRWITCGQIADVFVLLGRCDGQPTAFLVERESPGLTITPIHGMLGCRGYMLATLQLAGCRIPAEHLVGRVGFGLSHVAAHGLDAGRYGLAWCCVGIAQACLEASLHHTAERRQFGVRLREHQLIQRMITQMMTGVRAARLLCCQAGYRREAGEAGAILETAIAKYFAARTLATITADAVQIHGALGLSSESPVQRYLRDAKIMEVIEGTTQIQETTIAQWGYREVL